MTKAKQFALVMHDDRTGSMVWFATGEHDDMVADLGNAIATHEEDNYFMVLRVYASGNGELRNRQPV